MIFASNAAADQEQFTLAEYQWEKRVLVLSAAAAHNPDLQGQEAEIAARADDMIDRDMVVVTLLDDGSAMAGERKLAPNEVAKIRARLSIPGELFALRLIGKDGSVKLSRDSVTPMSDVFALIDTMPMRRSEIASRN